MYPTLRKLSDYGMRQAYLHLLVASRSWSQFQKFHDTRIPVNCRLPRQDLLALKHEWEQTSGFTRDEELLKEFNVVRGDSDLLALYVHAMREHSLVSDDRPEERERVQVIVDGDRNLQVEINGVQAYITAEVLDASDPQDRILCVVFATPVDTFGPVTLAKLLELPPWSRVWGPDTHIEILYEFMLDEGLDIAAADQQGLLIVTDFLARRRVPVRLISA